MFGNLFHYCQHLGQSFKKSMRLGDEIATEIASGSYVCLVCHDNITDKSEIWSCVNCYRAYDVNCIRQWARRSASGDWKCPHCAHLYPKKTRISYRCWCRKTTHPEPAIGQPPHSCGQTCGAKLSCPHPCTKTCHPGPHEEVCHAIGPEIKCYCKKNKIQRPCASTPYSGWSCKTECNTTRKCGHECKRICHAPGKCGPCSVKIEFKCEGCDRKVTRLCKDTKKSKSCGRKCTKMLACGIHKCSGKKCGHRGDHHCPNSPSSSDRCPCGKHEAVELLGRQRKDCVEPLPVCGDICGKPLQCGHLCQSKCHGDKCPPCTVTERSQCRCGNKRVEHVCGEAQPECHSKCGVSLSCGRHKCRRECCPLRHRSRTLNDAYSDSDGHKCDRVCKKTLACGIHMCLERCHLGPCPPCLVSSSDDLSCPCGSTVLRAPIRCGTKMPACNQPCSREQDCGHPASHMCHDADIPCRPCAHAEIVKCACGESSMSVRCSEPPVEVPCAIRKELKCGHKSPEPCINGWSDDIECTHQCDKILACGHPCQKQCHDSSIDPCGACTLILRAECPCGNLRLGFECGEGMEIGCNETCVAVQYHPVLIAMYEADPKWCTMIEAQFRKFLVSDVKSLQLKPMKKSLRRFVHYYAEHCGLSSESIDWGANRSVRVVKTTDTHIPRVPLRRGAQYTRRCSKLMPEPIIEEATNKTRAESVVVNSDGWSVVNDGPTSSIQTATPAPSQVQYYAVLSQV